MKNQPLIGITLDWQEKGTFSSRPHYALRERFFRAIRVAGGLPVGIPYEKSLIPDYIARLDGLLTPGGNFASPLDWYVPSEEPIAYAASPRLEFDLEIIQAMLSEGKPVLGICAGMQLLGGLLGCRMTRNVHSYYNTKIDYLNEKPAEEYAYEVSIKPKTLLHSIVGTESMLVNTAHREAVVEVPDSVIINSLSPEGVIQGIEAPSYAFALGLQWHPEFFLEEANPHRKIFDAFVHAAST
jgi:putative glutamine amidotransferase